MDVEPKEKKRRKKHTIVSLRMFLSIAKKDLLPALRFTKTCCAHFIGFSSCCVCISKNDVVLLPRGFFLRSTTKLGARSEPEFRACVGFCQTNARPDNTIYDILNEQQATCSRSLKDGPDLRNWNTHDWVLQSLLKITDLVVCN
jgi:hypothetical protein